MPEIDSCQKNDNDNYAVMLPCNPNDFGEFISGLLGKPQTIEKAFRGTFEISKNNIINTYHLIEQRIQQQNDAQLIQFTVKIFYNDDTSVLLNSLFDFEHYNEIRPLESIGVTLSWTYLIKFKNKSVPEKQEINLTFNADTELALEDDDSILRLFRPTGITCRINHTERTWGIDIEYLLTGHIKSLTKMPTKPEQFIYKNSGMIGLLAGLSFLISMMIGAWNTYSIYRDKYLENINTMANNIKDPMDFLTFKMNNLLDFVVGGSESELSYIFSTVLLISFIISIILGTIISIKANNRPKSFVLLSQLAEDEKKKTEIKRKRNWMYFVLSILIGIITSIIGSILFKKFIENLV